MVRTLIVLLAGALITGANAQPAPADLVSPAPDDVALTIYRDNLAFITETREINLPTGRSNLVFKGVSDLMIPQTAVLREFTGVTLERNFDFNLLSQGAVLEKSVGDIISLIRTDPATGATTQKRARIVSARRGVVLDIDGQLETFDCSGLPERIVFDRLPEDLLSQPTLSIEVSAEEAGPQTFTISYLASGFDWQADYILDVSNDPDKADLTGWLTVSNRSAMSLSGAPTAIVAGELQRLYETRAQGFSAKSFFAACWPRGSTKTGIPVERDQVLYDAARPAPAPVTMMRSAMAPEAELAEDSLFVTSSRGKARREDLGDYKLFRTPEPTTVAAYQTKQILFLDETAIDVSKVHAFSFDPSSYEDMSKTAIEAPITPALVRYDIDNSADGALGQPLPEGTIRVMTDHQGGSFFLGADDIEDLAVGLPVEVEVAKSPTVAARTSIRSAKRRRVRGGKYAWTVSLEHLLTNANTEAVTVEIAHGKDSIISPLTISRASVLFSDTDGFPKAMVRVPANASLLVTLDLAWTEN